MSSSKHPASRLFMVAQLPFNTQDAVTINKPMIPMMNHVQNLPLACRNLRQLGILEGILQKDSRFLEIGCGNGYLLEWLVKHGEGRYMGVEPIQSEAQKAMKRLKPYVSTQSPASWVHHGTLEETHFTRKIAKHSLDVIYSYHVFEHLNNPLDMLTFGQERLKKGGKLIITCPNVEGYFPRKNLMKWRCNLSSHRWLPGRKTLLTALEHHDYRVVKIFTYGGYPAPRKGLQSFCNQVFKVLHLGDIMCMMAVRT